MSSSFEWCLWASLIARDAATLSFNFSMKGVMSSLLLDAPSAKWEFPDSWVSINESLRTFSLFPIREMSVPSAKRELPDNIVFLLLPISECSIPVEWGFPDKSFLLFSPISTNGSLRAFSIFPIRGMTPLFRFRTGMCFLLRAASCRKFWEYRRKSSFRDNVTLASFGLRGSLRVAITFPVLLRNWTWFRLAMLSLFVLCWSKPG